MPPHTTPGRFKCTAFGCAAGGAIERLPDHDPRQQRGEGHSRSYSETSITASQATRMLPHVVPGQPACLNSQSTDKLPPIRGPGLSAPERNAGSQVPMRPREFRVIVTSLPASRLAAACRLRRSCHRRRGPVALTRSGCPVRRSRHPAALWCGRCLPLRLHSESSSSKVCAGRTSSIAPLDLS